MLDFRVESFLKVCQYMNFTHAAQALNLTQPAISQHIKYLEEKYETKLLVRDKNNLSLTASGKILLAALETMRNDETTLKNRIKEGELEKKSLTFGLTMTVGEYTIVPALVSLIKAHPDTNFHIRYGNTQTLLNYLHQGSIDFAIVEGFFKPDNYETLAFRTEEYIPVASSNHIFNKNIKFLADLTSERLITREQGSGTRAVLIRALALKNLSVANFENIIEVENIHTMVSLLRHDCGISFLYKSAVEKEIEDGVLREIPLLDFQIKHDFTFLWNKNSVFSKDYFEIFQELQSYLELKKG